MQKNSREKGPAESTVHIYMGDIEIQQFPDDLELSADGIRFRSAQPLKEMSVVELRMEVPGKTSVKEKAPGEITCAGLVLDCHEDKQKDPPYSVLVKFLSIPASSREKLVTATTQAAMKCPFEQAS